MTEVTEDAVFRDEDWYGDEFAERRFVRCSFHEVDLTEAVTRGAVFEQCVFGNVRFNASHHTDSAFLRCTFTRCNLFEAEFTGCKMVGSTFTECVVRPLRVVGGDWSFVGLSGADLRRTSFDGVRMREVDLTGADLTGAAVVSADLSGAHLAKAKFGKADLRGSDLTAFVPGELELAGATIDDAQAIVIAQTLGLIVR
ncbi:hypothetical protein Cs7R123_61090 [Catellatospora sp. TT07R-123]|uniref:pentapeptide repeat-containing protein n=1 Tax=Catellatospora sp. TT07R-123 TaxID=2733863 RepID=UPI001B237D0B|nr:pentapeptide repeat-containing protein [Catellatospora sp. TT07R-123]GHJ48767.1 hypothetical protein Cs7R123_61090 [Catellatospora sp. TT07R-123]